MMMISGGLRLNPAVGEKYWDMICDSDIFPALEAEDPVVEDDWMDDWEGLVSSCGISGVEGSRDDTYTLSSERDLLLQRGQKALTDKRGEA
jgi:hypothetical protein